MARPWCRWSGCALLVFVLALPVAALPNRSAVRESGEIQEAAGILPRLLTVLVSVFEKTGSTLDPFGSPQPAVTSTNPGSPAAGGDPGDTGSTLDPFGGR